jgi:hypothetical protein
MRTPATWSGVDQLTALLMQLCSDLAELCRREEADFRERQLEYVIARLSLK